MQYCRELQGHSLPGIELDHVFGILGKGVVYKLGAALDNYQKAYS